MGTFGQTCRSRVTSRSHLLQRPAAGVEVARPQAGAQRMVAAENVQGQVTVRVVITVEEAAELMTVQRIVGGVEVEHDPLWRRRVLLHEPINQVIFDLVQVGDHLLVTAAGIGADRRQLEAVERTLAGQRLAAVGRTHTVLARADRSCPPAPPSMDHAAIGRGHSGPK